MKLYYAPGSCSQAVHIALREVGVPFALERVDLRSRKTESGHSWDELNPKGYVPMLELDDGGRMTEVAALLQYVADRKPDSGLAPAAGSVERYRLLEWLAFISSELHKTFAPHYNPAFPEDARKQNLERAKKRFDYVAGALGDKPFLLGTSFTVADAYLFVMLSWARMFKLDLSSLPALEAYAVRVGSRPTVQEALRAEGLK